MISIIYAQFVKRIRSEGEFHLDGLVGSPELKVVPVLHQEGHQAQDEACAVQYSTV